jgi:predicted aspartyl protease
MHALQRRDLLLATMLLPFIGKSEASASSQTPAPEPAAELAPETAIPAQISNSDRMVVNVTIGGGGPYPFVIDTAAERSVISLELARELGLQQSGSARILSINSTREVNLFEAPGVSFLPGQARDLRVFALRGEHVGAAGVLGIDALRGQRVVLDFETQQMRVGPAPRRGRSTAADEIVVRGRLRYGQLVLADADVDGEHVDVIVDSGLQVSVGNEPLQRLLTNRRSDFTDITLVSITGDTLNAQYTRVNRLRIGNVAITGLPIAFAQAHFFRRMRMTRRPALLLGMDALQMFRRVAVDFPNRTAHFVMPDDISAPQASR